MTVERRTYRKPGHDCRRECRHEPKGEHGIHSDEWWFAVVDGGLAVSLTVFSGLYPESVDRSTLPACVSECSASTFATHRADPNGKECDYVEGGLCTGALSFLRAERFWKRHGVPEAGLEQPESFWSALETELRKVEGS